jgi:hypothetical protein
MSHLTPDIGLELPPFYSNGENIQTWFADIMNSPYGLPCICSDQVLGSDVHVVRPRIVNICQRENAPCIIDVSFHLGTAIGIYNYQPALSGFSVDTTNGVDGTWHELRPDTSDTAHNPSMNNTSLAGGLSVDATWDFAQFNPNNSAHGNSCDPNLNGLGIPVQTFVFDMCEHLTTWFAENTVSFRLTFNTTQVVGPSSQTSCSLLVT